MKKTVKKCKHVRPGYQVLTTRRITTRYTEVGCKVQVSGPCVICGKKTTKTRVFHQTESPHNKMTLDDGTVVPKDRITMYTECEKEADEWIEQYELIHDKCWRQREEEECQKKEK